MKVSVQLYASAALLFRTDNSVFQKMLSLINVKSFPLLRLVLNFSRPATHLSLSLDGKPTRLAPELVQLTAPSPVHTQKSLCTKIKAIILHEHL
jgi:hypothetical protein